LTPSVPRDLREPAALGKRLYPTQLTQCALAHTPWTHENESMPTTALGSALAPTEQMESVVTHHDPTAASVRFIQTQGRKIYTAKEPPGLLSSSGSQSLFGRQYLG